MQNLFLLTLVILTGTAQAHPVSFEGSTGVMGFHSPAFSHNQINYSWKHWFATGVHHYRRTDVKNRHATLASANFLLKRWNGRALQANLYGVLGAGQSELSGETKAAGLGLIQFDIEDRDYYFLTKHSRIVDKDETEFEHTVVRAGLTPYVDPFEGLHTWLILEYQASRFAGESTNEELTPLLRIFHRNLLFEIGQSFNGSTQFNYISHF